MVKQRIIIKPTNAVNMCARPELEVSNWVLHSKTHNLKLICEPMICSLERDDLELKCFNYHLHVQNPEKD